MSRESQDGGRKLSWLQLAADWLALIRDSSPAYPESDLSKSGGTGSADGQNQPSITDGPRDHAPDAGESAPDR